MNSAIAVQQIIEPEPLSGARNMAIDAELLEASVNEGRAAVRIYRWSEPTISLGYFQTDDEVGGDSPLAGLPAVKRLTGGGAILHHHEWTYSCALPAGHSSVAAPYELYATVHRAIIAVLSGDGVTAHLRHPAGGRRQPADPDNDETRSDVEDGLRGLTPAGSPFLCFLRGDPNDILLNGHKIVGSAQRRRKGAVLQHGSILMRASEFAPQIPGIQDLSVEFQDSPQFGEQLAATIAVRLDRATFPE